VAELPVEDLEARLARMPEPPLSAEDRELVERVLAAGFVHVPGASPDAHRVLARRGVERALRRERRRVRYLP
jgi:hypothetical protein